MEYTGADLKKIRLEKGLTLEDAQKKTKIHLNILKAIEGDSLTNLSPIYLKGFIKIYCKFLGLEPKSYIADYQETQTQPLKISKTKVIWDRPEKSGAFIKSAMVKLTSLRSSKKVRALLILVLTIILLSLGLFNLGKTISFKRKAHLAQKSPLSLPEKKVSKKQEHPKKLPAVSKQVKPAVQGTVMSSAKKELATGIRLGIRARENCWVSLKVDSKVVFQRVLEKGRFESWQAKEKIELSLGNAGAVELEVNDQLFSNLGKKGQALKNILITKEGLNIKR